MEGESERENFTHIKSSILVRIPLMLVSEDDSAMEVNSNAREYEPRPAGQAMLATGGGVLARLNVATLCSARKDDARRVALILVVGVVEDIL